MIPAPRPPAEQELPPGAGRVVAALEGVDLPTIDSRARARIREQLVDAARSDPAQ